MIDRSSEREPEVRRGAGQVLAGALAGFLLGFLVPLFVFDPCTPREAWLLALSGAGVGAVLVGVAATVVNRSVSPLWVVPIVVFGMICCVPWFPYEKAGTRLPDLPVAAAYLNGWSTWPMVLAWHLLATAIASAALIPIVWLVGSLERGDIPSDRAPDP